jgi:hypothetical protein
MNRQVVNSVRPNGAVFLRYQATHSPFTIHHSRSTIPYLREQHSTSFSVIMSMNSSLALILFICFLAACNNKSGNPDVSHIKVDVALERFEQSFFSIDSNNIAPGLLKTREAFPNFYPDFMQNILGVSGSDNDSMTLNVTRQFLSSYHSFAAELAKKFRNLGNVEKDIRKGFQFVKYYFPDYRLPKQITYIGPLDAPGVALTRHYLAIGLQQFAGKDFPGYSSAEVQQMFPAYISRRFDPAYIPANSLKAIVDDLFPDQTTGKPLIEQIIQKGKQWWLLDKFMPGTHDSLKTGYTKKQLEWCKNNEGLVWNYFMTSENLEAIEPSVIQNYIGEAPTTQGMPQDAPGNIGQWVGRQIVEKFAEKNASMSPAEIMNTPARKILEGSRYKPK